MAQDDQAYFRRRAEQELELAQRALDGAVVQAHYRLAEAYLEKLESGDATGPDDTEQSEHKPLFDFSPDGIAASPPAERR